MDFWGESLDKTSGRHLFIEGVVVALTFIGSMGMLYRIFNLSERLFYSKTILDQTKIEVELLQKESEKYLQSARSLIDRQFNTWKFSEAEKEVAICLLRGYPTKTIASMRYVTEKTVRTQASSVYAKSGLSGRAELVAFFLPLFFGQHE